VTGTPQPGYTYAPVAQVQAGASEQTIQSQLGKVAGEVGKKLGEGVVQGIFGQ